MNTAVESKKNATPGNELAERQLQKLVADGVKAARQGSGIVPVDTIVHARRRAKQQAEKNNKPKK